MDEDCFCLDCAERRLDVMNLVYQLQALVNENEHNRERFDATLMFEEMNALLAAVRHRYALADSRSTVAADEDSGLPW